MIHMKSLTDLVFVLTISNYSTILQAICDTHLIGKCAIYPRSLVVIRPFGRSRLQLHLLIQSFHRSGGPLPVLLLGSLLDYAMCTVDDCIPGCKMSPSNVDEEGSEHSFFGFHKSGGMVM